jgi:ABC-type glycerol-3-phosphate transport system permease component
MGVLRRIFGGKTGKRVSRSTGGDLGILLLLLFVAAFMSLPFLYAIMQSLKPMEEIFIFPPRFFVRSPSLENFRQIGRFANSLWVPFSRYLSNSVFITVSATFGQVVFCSMAAFVLSKGSLRFAKTLFALTVAMLLFSYDVTAIPLYIVLSKMDFIDTYWALILPAVAAPLGLFLMKQYMETIPQAIIESARVDGAGPFTVYARIVMPTVKPAWITLVILSFQSIWSREGLEFIYSEQLKVVPTLLRQLSAGGIARVGIAAAAAVIMIVPPIVTFVVSQSRVIDTMAHSGIK